MNSNNLDLNIYLKKCPKIKTLIHWYDLPDNKVIILDRNFQIEITKRIYNNLKYGDKQKIADKIGVTRSQLNFYSKLKSNFSIWSLKRMLDYLGIPFDKVESKISELGRKKTIKKPNFPFNMNSKEGVAFRSIINSEGHISKTIGRSLMIRVPEVDMLKKSVYYANKIFWKFHTEIKKTKDKNSYEVFMPGEISDVLILSGLTRGRKTIKDPYVPKDIMLGSIEIQRRYLQWSFAGEMECNKKCIKLTRYVNTTNTLSKRFIEALPLGQTFKGNIPLKIIDNLKISKLLIGEILLLRNFGIIKEPKFKCLWKAKSGRVSAAWSILLTNKREIEILFRDIGLPLKEKSEKVLKELNSYIRI